MTTLTNPPPAHGISLADGLRFCTKDVTAYRVTLEGGKEYEVRLFTDGEVGVWRLFDRKPVNSRGYYQADNGARRVDPHGKTGRRAVETAMRLMQELLASKAHGQ